MVDGMAVPVLRSIRPTVPLIWMSSLMPQRLPFASEPTVDTSSN